MLLLVLFTLQACPLVVGQTPQSEAKGIKGLSFSLNMGIPVGDFAATDKSDDASGYANLAWGIDLNYLAAAPLDDFTFMATARYSSFGYDIDAVTANYKADAPTQNALWYGTGENWKMWTLLVGGNIGSLHTKEFSLGVRAQIGWLFLSSKDRYVNGISTVGNYFYRISYSNSASSSFSYLLGLNTRWQVSAKSSFVTGIDYMSASPDIDYVSTLASAQVPIETKQGTFTQPINAITINAGFVFLF